MMKRSVTIYTIIFCLGALIICLGSLTADAQSRRLNKADRYFENFAYYQASALYLKEARKSNSGHAIRRLAVCYREMKEIEKAAGWYEKLLLLSNKSPDDHYQYAQLMMQLEKYGEALVWMKKFHLLAPDDSRAERYLLSGKIWEKLKADSGRYLVKNMSFNSENSDISPSVQNGILYFSSSREQTRSINRTYNWNNKPFYDLYSIELANSKARPGLFSKKLNSILHDGPLSFSANGKEVYFTRNTDLGRKSNVRTNQLKISKAAFDGENWYAFEDFPYNSNAYSCGHPSLSPDGKYLFFISDMPGGFGGSDIYVCERHFDTWSYPRNLGSEINTEGDEMFPYIHENGNLYFASDGLPGLGGLDIFVAFQNNAHFFTAVNMGAPLNSARDDFSLVLIKDGQSGYFSSNRKGGQGDDDIYSVKILEEIKFSPKKLSGIAKQINTYEDSISETPLQSCKVMLMSMGKMVQEINSDENGCFNFLITKPGKYSITVNKKDGLLEKSQDVHFPYGEDSVFMEFKFRAGYRIKNLVYQGRVIDEKTNNGINKATVFILNKNDGIVNITKTDPSGYYEAYLNWSTEYIFRAMKDQFLSDCFTYITTDSTSEESIEPLIEMRLEQYEVNQVFQVGKLYYDYDKWNIREDAARELDKVVLFMSKNPELVIELGSHTDARGSDKYNMRLSKKRAESAVEYIISRGISRERITARGYGETQLTNRCGNGVQCSEAEHQANRRTEMKITGTVKPAGGKYKSPGKFNDGDNIDIRYFEDDFFNCER